MKEKWKDIPGYEGYYKVSNFGRVKSLDRIAPKTKRKVVGKIMSVRYHHRYNYTSASVMLSMYGLCYEKIISRLVAFAFVPNPENKPYVNHIDYDATNNNFTNLEWVTQRENIDHSMKTKIHGRKRLL